jgi:hypothetical protein
LYFALSIAEQHNSTIFERKNKNYVGDKILSPTILPFVFNRYNQYRFRFADINCIKRAGLWFYPKAFHQEKYNSFIGYENLFLVRC